MRINCGFPDIEILEIDIKYQLSTPVLLSAPVLYTTAAIEFLPGDELLYGLSDITIERGKLGIVTEGSYKGFKVKINCITELPMYNGKIYYDYNVSIHDLKAGYEFGKQLQINCHHVIPYNKGNILLYD